MSETGENLPQIGKVKRWIDKVLGKKIEVTPPALTNLPESTKVQYDEEAVNRAFARAKSLVDSGNLKKNPEGKKLDLPISYDGGIFLETSVELLESQEMLDLQDANVGDTVWFRDNKNHVGYYFVTVKRDVSNGNKEPGEGILTINLDDGILEPTRSRLEGGGFGMIKSGHIVKNQPLTIWHEKNPPGYRSFTSEIEVMGIIRNSNTNSS